MPLPAQPAPVYPTTVTVNHASLRSAFGLLFAIAHFALSATLALADGTLEARTAVSRTYAHIESHGTPDCPRVHLDDCALCRAAHTDAGDPPRSAAYEGVRAASVAPRARGPGGFAERVGCNVSSRAPPGATAPRTSAA